MNFKLGYLKAHGMKILINGYKVIENNNLTTLISFISLQFIDFSKFIGYSSKLILCKYLLYLNILGG